MIAAYLKLTGEKSGAVKGPVADRDTNKNGSIALLGVEHGIASPRDVATGLASGKRQHQPIVVTKETDRTSPVLTQMLVTNEAISALTLFFFGDDDAPGLMGGRETLLYKIELKNAFVSRIEMSGRVDDEADAGARLPLSERVSFVYASISWEWVNGGIMAQDGWSTGN